MITHYGEICSYKNYKRADVFGDCFEPSKFRMKFENEDGATTGWDMCEQHTKEFLEDRAKQIPTAFELHIRKLER